MLYSIDGIENVLDLMAYTVSSMKEVGYSDCDVDDYIEEAIKSNNYDIIISRIIPFVNHFIQKVSLFLVNLQKHLKILMLILLKTVYTYY